MISFAHDSDVQFGIFILGSQIKRVSMLRLAYALSPQTIRVPRDQGYKRRDSVRKNISAHRCAVPTERWRILCLVKVIK